MAGRPSPGNRKSGRRRRKHKARMSNKGDGEEEGEEEEGEQLYTMDDDDTVQLVVNSEHPSRKKIKRKKLQMPNSIEEDSVAENVWLTTIQVFVPFLVAGLGMVGAGLVLDVVQHWDVFRVVTEVFILVPALLGLKGNLEMTLASRLSTQANLGIMDSRKEQWKLIAGNMALIQCQAIVVGSLAAIAAVVMGWIPNGEFEFDHALLLCASSMLTASLASFVLGMIMVAVILFSRWVNINPDNVATPIAASLGDLTTLALLSWIASMLFEAIGQNHWLAPAIILGCLFLTPLWGYIAASNHYTKEVLDSGWTPVISSMVISSAGGLILDFTVSNFKGIAVFQPVINGVGGNLVAVQASRISTSLHQRGHPGYFPPGTPALCLSPFAAFCGSGSHSRTARVLLGMVIPGHLIFSYTISYLHAGHTSFTAIFMLIYLAAAVLQVILLLYIAHVMTLWMWKEGIDPDNSAIPYLTAIGDLLGTGLLALAFQLLYLIGDRDSDVGD
ncbi:solute carrier family 41 member 1-like [Thrips palmi]|uniref:Solute carrier family 41 member 1-like n=1 Tax=Thrips palmi TaxID=161013 RepID=A0A6P9A442_THRPL|nr:solute carrier family 41 member 1-like [Thrips palmi]XP_034251994.1 solute carrier family 41 member 1-like [Thrips palmi]XP_034251996.1 solute carrier family 41 member 1-like [Thrips palmi]XP_034251997.1 solute carrier family 41 member 1-like [Thrips palmi]XP_034251998.1 solute carrier family 41 member 1-like [Thrips palmi]